MCVCVCVAGPSYIQAMKHVQVDELFPFKHADLP